MGKDALRVNWERSDVENNSIGTWDIFLLTASLFAQTPPASVADTSKGKTWVNTKGMTLYVFTRDSPGKTSCYGTCATNWPPFLAATDDKAFGDWTIVKRDDGSFQWAYKDKPLYTWIKDTKPGDVTGDGFSNRTWLIAAP